MKTDKIEKDIVFAVISDFHYTNAKEVLNHINHINPDAVLIPGDLIDENRKLDTVKELIDGHCHRKVFYVSGNHEFKKGIYYKSYRDLKKLLQDAGVICLENEAKKAVIHEQMIWIGGVHDHCADQNLDYKEADSENVRKVCQSLDENLFSILLMHRPEQYRFVEQTGVDLLVSGHAHGGQWRFPGINGLYAPQQGFFPERAGGEYPLNQGIHLVSRGLAQYWFLPRICNHREINIVMLQAKKKAD